MFTSRYVLRQQSSVKDVRDDKCKKPCIIVYPVRKNVMKIFKNGSRVTPTSLQTTVFPDAKLTYIFSLLLLRISYNFLFLTSYTYTHPHVTYLIYLPEYLGSGFFIYEQSPPIEVIAFSVRTHGTAQVRIERQLSRLREVCQSEFGSLRPS